MDKAKIDRINSLYHKQVSEGLSPAEKEEQAALRAEYVAEFRASFGAQLDHTVIERPDGSREHLHRKPKIKH